MGVDDKKALGALMALGNAIGAEARGNPDVITNLRAVGDAAALGEFLVAHRGNVPEALARAFAAGLTDESFPKLKAKLVLQAKMAASGGSPVSAADAAKGPVKHR